MNMKKNRIRLTESDLFNIIRESTRKIIKENEVSYGQERNYVSEAMDILRGMEQKYKKIVNMYDNGRETTEDDMNHMVREMSTLLFNDLRRAISTLSHADY